MLLKYIREAFYAHSKTDFVSKLQIALTVAVPFRPCSMQKRKTKRLSIFQTNNGRFAGLLPHKKQGRKIQHYVL